MTECDDPENIGFEEPVNLAVAANYRRLKEDPDSTALLAKLKGRKIKPFSDWDIEILLRTIAGIPRDWKIDNERTAVRAKQRATLARKLSRLANEVDSDLELSGLCFGSDYISSNTPPEERAELLTLAEAMRLGAAELAPVDLTMLGSEPRANKPEMARRISLQSYALLAIFEYLKPHFGRAPNRETEILASALLGEPIRQGTVTQLRKNERSRHYRDKK